MTRHLLKRASNQEHVSKVFRTEPLGGQELFETSISELQQHQRDRIFTSLELTKHCLSRIQSIDQYIEAVLEVNPDASDIAADLDRERERGITRGPLHGIPVLVKDNMATKDKMQTTAGSWALLGSKVPKDAFVVSKLREAGAVILGHANMSEWSSVRSRVYSTGYSPRRGQARNPFDLRKSPFGSSSGSAVAVSANLVPLAFGTETDTSIIGPAAANGVVGFKPTVGLTSRSGVIPISENMDSVGAFARTVADVAFGLTAIAGQDPDDKFTEVPARRQETDYSSFLSTKDSLKGACFGLPIRRCWDSAPEDCKRTAFKVFEAMRAAGAEIVDVDFPSVDERVDPDGGWNWEHGEPQHSEFTVAKVDAYNGLNKYLAALSETPIRSIEDVLEYNQQNKGTEGPSPGDLAAFSSGHDLLEEIIAYKGNQDSIYQCALEHMQKQTRLHGIDAALKYTGRDKVTRNLDALLMCDRRGIGQQYAAQAGYPIIVIPIGLDMNGMPVGLSLHHTAWKEAELIKWASAIENLWNESNGWRATPTYRNHRAKNIPIEKIK